MRLFILFLIGLLVGLPLTGGEQNGTLIVSYQTGPDGERLDRIRFRLTDEKQQQRLYPQGGHYVSDVTSPNRIVAVNDLAPGAYTVDFVVPNADGLFEEAPKRTIRVESGQTVKLDHYFHPRYATLKASVSAKSEFSSFAVFPLIRLENHAHQLVAESTEGSLLVKKLTPGNYHLIFGCLPGYVTPKPLELTIEPNEEVGPFIGEYDCEFHQSGPEVREQQFKPGGCVTLLLSVIKEIVFPTLYAEGQESAQGEITILSNLPLMKWILYRDDLKVYEGKGSEYGILVVPADNYRLRVEEPDGYTVKMSPPQPFTVAAGQAVHITLDYEKAFGAIEVKAVLPQGGTIHVDIRSANPQLKPLQETIQAKNSRLEWTSPPIPTGSYSVTLQPSEPYTSLPVQTVQVEADKTVVVQPEVTQPKSLRVITHLLNAAFVLKDEKGTRKWEGRGSDFTFHALPPGQYTLTFISPNPDIWQAPAEMKVSISPYQDSTVKATYDKMGKLTVQSGMAIGKLVMTPENDTEKTIEKEIHQGVQTLLLPAGSYQTVFQPSAGSPVSGPISQQVTIHPGQTEMLRLAGEGSSPSGQIPVQPSLSLPPAGTSEMAFADVEGGESMMGDVWGGGGENVLPPLTIELKPFSIGVYEVTNGQYAEWLNEALAAGKITYQREGAERGLIKDADGNPICRTSLAVPLSQIEARVDMAGRVAFAAVADKGRHPVVEVSWHGANAFCADKGYRLPTEAEWEKAAGLEAAQPYQPLKMYRYGFSRNAIDRTWANYRYDAQALPSRDVLTTEVGYYNGVHLLLPTADSSLLQVTHKAVSPFGAYDMSGNVWEWVADWYHASYEQGMSLQDPKGPASGTHKVLKGGSYNSSADDVRVAARRGQPPEHMDGETGFRVVKIVELSR